MNRLLSTILAPGVALMRRLRLPMKLGLIGLALFVPLMLLLSLSLRSGLADIATARSEHEGVLAARQILDLAEAVQVHRGLTNRVLSGDTGAAAARDEARAKLRQALQATQATLDGLHSFSLADAWAAPHGAIAALTEGRHAAQPARAFQQHADQVDALRGLLLTVGERSTLLLDPVAASYFLMDVVLERVLPWTETMGLMRGQGSGLLARGQASAEERAGVLGRLELLRREGTDIERRMAALKRAGASEPPAFRLALQTAERFAQRTQATFTAATLSGGGGAAYFDQGSQAIRQVSEFRQQGVAALDAMLLARLEQAQRSVLLQLCASVLGVLALIYLATAFFSSFVGAMRALAKGMTAVAGGDLSHHFAIRGRDEPADLGHVIEDMADRLSSMVSEIRSSAVRVSGTGSQLADGSAALAQRTEEQAGSLRQFVVTVDQLSHCVADNAAHAQQLDSMTTSLHAQAEEGGQAMHETVQSLGALEASSRRVHEIVAVIDDIAFQTNILALNAAVEAARAGEAGMGFAVVADEVRALAQRSAQAARDTAGLIEEAIQRSGEGQAKSRHVAEAIASVTSGTGKITDLMNQVSQASTQQTQGLDQVTQAIAQMEKVTQSTAATAEESAAASEELNTQADAALHAVQRLTLLVGSQGQDVPASKGHTARPAAPLRLARGKSPVSGGHDEETLPATGTYGSF